MSRAIPHQTYLKKNGYVPNIILLAHWPVVEGLTESPKFIPSWDPRCPKIEVPGCSGSYEGLPVFDIQETKDEACVVLDLMKLGKLCQYQIADQPQQLIHLDLQVIDKDRAIEFLSKRPELLKDRASGLPRPVDHVVRELMQQVTLEIMERIRFEVSDPKAGVFIKLESMDNANSVRISIESMQ